MKKALIIVGLLVLWVALVCRCRGATVVFNFQSGNSAPQAVRTVNLYPTGTFTNGSGAIITRDRFSGTTDTNGSLTVSNVYGWTYRGEIIGTTITTTNWYNFPVTNGLILAADFTGPPTNQVLTYSQAQIDGSFVHKAGDSMTGSLTNAAGFVGPISGRLTNEVRQADSASVSSNPAQALLGVDSTNGFTVTGIGPGLIGAQPASANLTSFSGFTTGAVAGAAASIGSIMSNRWPAIINVRDFGALGTGGSPPNDDSLAISNAWAAWTNRGGILYFPAGTYVDTNSHILNMSGQAALDGVGIWNPFTIAGEGAGASRWQAKITNATFIWSTNFPVGFSNIRIECTGTGTTHGFRIAGAPQGNVLLSQCVFRNFTGYGYDAGAMDLGQCVQARFDACGAGLRVGGFGDDWSGTVFATRCSFAGLIIGFTNFNSLGIRLTEAANFYVGGNLNQNAVIVGPGYGTTLSGALESSTNAAICIGFPPVTPAWVENAPQDASGAIGSVSVRNFNQLDNGYSNVLVKVYTAPRMLHIEDVNAGTSGGTAVHSTLAAGDTIPMMLRGVIALTNVLFSDGGFIPGLFHPQAGPMNLDVNEPLLIYNKATNTFSVDHVNGLTNGAIAAPGVVGSRDFTNWVVLLANTFALDPDASNYLSRAGITDFVTKYAVNQFALDLKQPMADGFIQWTNLNVCHPMLGGTSNSTAINLLGNTNHITWQASGGTYSSQGVTGNGTSFYGDCGLNLKTGTGGVYSTNGMFIAVYCGTTSPTDLGRLASGEQFNSFTVRNGPYPTSGSLTMDGPNNASVTTLALGVSSDFRGPIADIRIDASTVALACRTNWTSLSSAATATPNATFGYLARDTDQGQDHFSNAQLRGGMLGGALTQARWNDLRTKWERLQTMLGRQSP